MKTQAPREAEKAERWERGTCFVFGWIREKQEDGVMRRKLQQGSKEKRQPRPAKVLWATARQVQPNCCFHSSFRLSGEIREKGLRFSCTVRLGRAAPSGRACF